MLSAKSLIWKNIINKIHWHTFTRKTQKSDFDLLTNVLLACPREGVLPGLEPDGACVGRQDEPGHLAGGLAMRAQRPRRL